MTLTINQDWNEVEKILQKPQVLSIWNDNNIMMTLTWEDWKQEVSTLWDFLCLTDIEQEETKTMNKLWYTLVWDRITWFDYPEYFKDFHDSNFQLFLGWKEIYITRDQFKADTSDEVFPDRQKRELIFVKLNIQKPAAPKIQEETTWFKEVIKGILAGIWYWK